MNILCQGLLQAFRLSGSGLRTLITSPSPFLSFPPPKTPTSNPPPLSNHLIFSILPFRLFSTTEEDAEEEEKDIEIPPPPTNCCMSGCANCVWITYAQELAAIYKDSERASEKVMRAIDDPSLKIFLNLELKELSRDSESENH